MFIDAGTELGFARYEEAMRRDALPFYESVLSYLPNEPESLRWLGRIHLELNEPDKALPYYIYHTRTGSKNRSSKTEKE